MNQQQFENFTASSLYCEKCKAAMPVRERLLLVLPDREIFDYLCTNCGSSVGRAASTDAVIWHAYRFYRRRRNRRADAASVAEVGIRGRRDRYATRQAGGTCSDNRDAADQKRDGRVEDADLATGADQRARSN